MSEVSFHILLPLVKVGFTKASSIRLSSRISQATGDHPRSQIPFRVQEHFSARSGRKSRVTVTVLTPAGSDVTVWSCTPSHLQAVDSRWSTQNWGEIQEEGAGGGPKGAQEGFVYSTVWGFLFKESCFHSVESYRVWSVSKR